MKLADMLRGKIRDDSLEEQTREDTVVTPEWKEEVESLPINLIKPSPYQPRTEFASDGLAELAASISEHGILHPVVVRKISVGYELVVGERRLRACKSLGWEAIPAIVRQLSDKAAAEMALIENLQRRDLHYLEEAEGYQRLLEEFELTQEGLAHRLAKSQSSIANKLRL